MLSKEILPSCNRTAVAGRSESGPFAYRVMAPLPPPLFDALRRRNLSSVLKST